MKGITNVSLGIIGAALLATQASAATVTYVNKVNSSTGTDNAASDGSFLTHQLNFRTTDVAKTFDVNGDNIYGSDGYRFFGTSDNSQVASGQFKGTLTSLPSYIASANPVGTYGPPGNLPGTWSVAQAAFGRMDNPTLSGAGPLANVDSGLLSKKFDNTAPPSTAGILDIVLASDATFRIGISQISGDRQKGAQLILGGVAVNTLPPGGSTGGTVGGDGTATNNYGRFDLYFFDVAGLAGETITLQVTNAFNSGGVNGNDQVAIGGIVFDSVAAVPEPTSLGLLATGLVALTARRRRR